jgi:hypothetical protein
MSGISRSEFHFRSAFLTQWRKSKILGGFVSRRVRDHRHAAGINFHGRSAHTLGHEAFLLGATVWSFWATTYQLRLRMDRSMYLPKPIALFSLLCLPHIKSGHIGSAVRPESGDRECVRLSRRRVVQVHPCSMTSEFACRCSNSCTTAARGADGVRPTPRYDQCIPCGSSRSTVLHKRFAKVNEETSVDLEYRLIHPDV